MDVQLEKLQLIEQLTKLEDVGIILRIKELLSEKVVGSTPDGNMITEKKLIARAEASNLAIKNGEITSIEDLEEESKLW
jgi:hypothetical protein